MSQQTYTHFNRVVNRNGDILPGQRKARIGSMTDLASSGDGDNLRPSTSQGLTEHQKPRYTSAGSEDLFLNLANDPLANTRSNRTEESQVTANSNSTARSVPASGGHSLFSRRDLTSQSRPLSTTPDDGYRTRRSLYAPQESTYSSRNIDTTRVSSSDYQTSPLATYSSRSTQSPAEASEKRESEYARLARQRISQISGAPTARTSFQINDVQDNSRSNYNSGPDLRINGDDGASVLSDKTSSIVWDELEELKSRINSLEKGRPRTNTTSRYDPTDHQRTSTLTSLVSQYEPQRTSTLTSRTGAPDFRLEPQPRLRPVPGRSLTITPQQLLETALANAKSSLPRTFYTALETHAQGILDLSLSLDDTNDTVSVASMITGNNTSSRNVRRRVDNLCRSLTEVCIALCDDNETQSTTGGIIQPRARATTNPLLTNGDSSPLVYASARRNLGFDSDASDRTSSRLSTATATEPRRSIVLSRASPRGDPTPPTTTSSSRTFSMPSHHTPRGDSPPRSSPTRTHTHTMSMTSETPRLSSLSSTSPRHIRESLDYTKSHPMPDPSSSPAAKRALRMPTPNLNSSREEVNEDGDQDVDDTASVGSGRTEMSSRTDRTETGRRREPVSRSSQSPLKTGTPASAPSAAASPRKSLQYAPATSASVPPSAKSSRPPSALAGTSTPTTAAPAQIIIPGPAPFHKANNNYSSAPQKSTQPTQSQSQSQSTSQRQTPVQSSRSSVISPSKSPSLISRLSERLMTRSRGSGGEKKAG